MDENALIVKRLGGFAERFRDYRGCPKGGVGYSGPDGNENIDEIDILKRNLIAWDAIKDVDGNVWTPVEETVLNRVLDALEELKKLRRVHHKYLEREREVDLENQRDVESGRCYASDGGPLGARGIQGPIWW